MPTAAAHASSHPRQRRAAAAPPRPSAGRRHDAAHRRLDRRRHRRAPPDARHQARRAEDRRHLQGLAHAGAPGAEPAEPRPARHAGAGARRPRRRRPSVDEARQVFEVRRMLESGDDPARRARAPTDQVERAARAPARRGQAAIARTDVSGPHAPARRLPRRARRACSATRCWPSMLAELVSRSLADRADVPVERIRPSIRTTSTSAIVEALARARRARGGAPDGAAHLQQRRAQPAPRAAPPDLAAVLRPGADAMTEPDIPRTLPARPGRLRPQPAACALAGRAPASPCSSSSTTRKAARTACCTATPAAETVPVRDGRPRQAFADRHLSMESIYEYGSRVGVWRILREFEQRGLPLTVFGVGMALERHPRARRRLRRTGPRDRLPRLALDPLPEGRRGDRARAHAGRHRRDPRSSPASAPLGWYTGRDSPNTRRLVADARRLRVRQRLLRRRPAVLDAGANAPTARRRRTSSCPTRSTPTTCASRCRRASAHGDAVLRLPARHLRRALRRRRPRRPPMMSDRHALPPARPARPHARAAALPRSRAAHDRVWICRRIDIARHWKQAHPFDRHRLRLGVTMASTARSRSTS